jgi:hypothetical protein
LFASNKRIPICPKSKETIPLLIEAGQKYV